MTALVRIVSVNPLTVEVPEEAGIRVDGEDFWAWIPGNEQGRIMGGSVCSPEGEVEHIADALRRTYPPEDIRWHRELPHPYWPNGTTTLAEQVDPHGNDAGDDHRATYCDGCGDTHYPDEHRTLTAPELATLRAAAAQSSFGVPYTDTYLIDRTIVARGILSNADNRRAYRDHVDTLVGMGYLELTEPTAPALGVTGTPVDITVAALEHLADLDRRNR